MFSQSYSSPLKLLMSRFFVLLIAVSLLNSGCQAKQKEHEAKQKLDQLLGQNEQQIQPEQQSPADPLAQDENTPSDPFSAFPDWAKNMMPGQPDIQVKEDKQSYHVVVGIKNPKDANSVKVTVLPHQVQVSGQSSFGKDGMQGSSSFFKSFSTSSELVPDQVKRQQHEQLLEFVIPKKVASDPLKPESPQQPLPNEHKQQSPTELSPDVLQQLDQSETHAI